MQKISFFVDGQKLNGTIYYPKKLNTKSPAILFFHGWRSSQDSAKGRASALSDAGFVCMTFDMRGCGASEGDFKKLKRKDYLDDALAAYDFLAKEREVNAENISIVGASFGAYLAALVVKDRDVKNLVLRAPANYPDESFDDIQFNFSGVGLAKELYAKFNNITAMKTYATQALNQFNGQVLIIESEHDDFIPHAMIETFKDAILDKGKLTHNVIKGADHAMRDESLRAEYSQILLNWFTPLKK